MIVIPLTNSRQFIFTSSAHPILYSENSNRFCEKKLSQLHLNRKNVCVLEVYIILHHLSYPRGQHICGGGSKQKWLFIPIPMYRISIKTPICVCAVLCCGDVYMICLHDDPLAEGRS